MIWLGVWLVELAGATNPALFPSSLTHSFSLSLFLTRLLPQTSNSNGQHQMRENGFDSRFGVSANLTSYNALYDPNMRHFFENSTVQAHLYRTGQIDRAGRVIDLDKNKSKLHIIEKEFDHAEREEELRQREEMEMRRRVQLKRHQALDKARKEEKVS